MPPSESVPQGVSDELGAWLSRRRRAGRLAAVILAVVALLAIGFFSAAFYRITAETPGSAAPWNAQVTSGWCLKFGTRLVMFSPGATVQVLAPGYQTQVQNLKRANPRRTVHFVMQPLAGVVHFTIEAEGDWTLEIGGRSYESRSEFTAELEQGTHSVAIEGAAIQPLHESIEVAGRGEEQEVYFEPAPYEAFATLITDPADATVAVNGVVADPEGGRYVLPFGQSGLTFSREGYHTEQRTVEASSTESVIDLGTIRLEPRPAILALTSDPSAASVFLNGKFIGETPAELVLDPGLDHALQLRKPGYKPKTMKVNLEPSASAKRHTVFDSVPIEVTVSANLEALIKVNGIARGNTPRTLSMQATDEVSVKLEGYFAAPVTITRAGGSSQSINFELVEEDQVAFVFAPGQVSVLGQIRLRKFGALEYSIPVLVSDPQNSVPDIRINVTRPFYMSIHEVTAEDYLSLKIPGEGSKLQPSSNPATNMSWAEAAKFCNLLSDREGLKRVYQFSTTGRLSGVDASANGYRLPTEAEWDAALGPSLSAEGRPMLYLWGDSPEIPRGYENFSGRESSKNRDDWIQAHVDNHVGLAPVGSYRPRANGMHDLAGNAAEWVHDFYESQYSKAGQNLVDPLGPESGSDHVVKGGTYRTSSLDHLKFHYRAIGKYRSDVVGFRVARWIQ